jgi:hypothetical protein
VRLDGEGRIDCECDEAEKLRLWLMDRPEPLISVSDALQRGPNALRSKEVIERCFTVLLENGWLIDAGPGEVGGRRRETTYRIVRDTAPKR